jgi:glycosyltransferase involved in cell wall biosynthesis
VVDDFSNDETPKIAESLGARVIQHRFEGFGAQKQFALEQTRNEWVLSLDADEVIPAALAREIQEKLHTTTYDGYRIRRIAYFLGHRLRFSSPGADRVLRLFRKSKGSFTRVPVHEQVIVDGRIADLSLPLHHYSFDSLEEYFKKSYRYAILAAHDRYSKGKRFGWFDFLRPFWELFSRLILRFAWLDGVPGVIYACLSSAIPWLRAICIWEQQNQQQIKNKS